MTSAGSVDSYLDTLRGRLQSAGLEEWTGVGLGVGESMTWHRRKFELSKFSVVDTFWVVKIWDQDPTAAEFTEFSRSVFDLAVSNKSRLPRGLGGMAIAHAVMVVGQAPSAVVETAETHSKTHWSSFEFPALVELDDPKGVHFLAGTKAVGAAFFKGLRTSVGAMLTPP